jgi:hypothetical protein
LFPAVFAFRGGFGLCKLEIYRFYSLNEARRGTPADAKTAVTAPPYLSVVVSLIVALVRGFRVNTCAAQVPAKYAGAARGLNFLNARAASCTVSLDRR